MVFVESIFCYNSANYEANFVILFPQLLLMIRALNILKHFPPHFNCIVTLIFKLLTFDIIPILLIF